MHAGGRCGVTPRAYADDTSASAHAVSHVESFLGVAGNFAKVTGQRLRPSKSKFWSTDDVLLDDMRALRLAGSQVEIVDKFDNLGVSFSFRFGPPYNSRSSRLGMTAAEVGRAACLPLSAEQRALLISSASIEKVLHACEMSPLPDSDLKKLRTSVLRALWHGRGQRVPEALTCLFYPGHRMDSPASASF